MSQVVEKEKQKQAIKPPKKHQCVLLNDDFTTWDFVIHVLQQHFGKSVEEAQIITKNVHQQGKGVCGVYSRDVAESKAILVTMYSQENEHPLMCIAEPVDEE